MNKLILAAAVASLVGCGSAPVQSEFNYGAWETNIDSDGDPFVMALDIDAPNRGGMSVLFQAGSCDEPVIMVTRVGDERLKGWKQGENPNSINDGMWRVDKEPIYYQQSETAAFYDYEDGRSALHVFWEMDDEFMEYFVAGEKAIYKDSASNDTWRFSLDGSDKAVRWAYKTCTSRGAGIAGDEWSTGSSSDNGEWES